MTPETWKTIEDLVCLLKCSLQGEMPTEKLIQTIDLDQMYHHAKRQSLAALVSLSLEAYWSEHPVDIQIKITWKEEREKSIRKTVLLDVERKKLFDWFEREGIWYMPLKGVILKKYYPAYGIRQMADNDILFDSTYAETVRNWFGDRGYTVEAYGKGNHDCYLKNPIYNFEMHRALFQDTNEIWYECYKDVKSRLIKDEGNSCGYHFSDEDFYVYFITHASKHFQGAGTGIRHLIDLYLYIDGNQDLDWGYVQKELHKLGIAENETMMRQLAFKLFSKDGKGFSGLTTEEEEYLEILFGAGTYGTAQQQVKNKLDKLLSEGKYRDLKSVKRKYIWERFFPKPEIYKNYYPFFYNHKWARPVLLFYRILHGCLVNRKKIMKEWRTLRGITIDRI